MAVFFLRHAKAGDRRSWGGNDLDRPLSKNGRKQAEGIRKELARYPISRVLSSPYGRCVQTVEPLAEHFLLKVEATDELAEGEPFEPVLGLIATLPDHSVLCTHGDVLPETIAALARRGMRVDSEPDWRKGA